MNYTGLHEDHHYENRSRFLQRDQVMRIRFRHILLFLVMCLMFSGCAGNSRQKEIGEISQKYGVSSERQLVVYTSHKEEVYLPIIREFENRTGIWVEVHAGGTNELLAQIKKSAGEGENACDIMFGGGVEAYEANRDLFLPYVSGADDNIAEAFRSSDNYWTPFTELPIVLVYNNKLVSEEEAPKSWADLSDARWKGRIAFADPTHSGSSYTIL